MSAHQICMSERLCDAGGAASCEFAAALPDQCLVFRCVPWSRRQSRRFRQRTVSECATPAEDSLFSPPYSKLIRQLIGSYSLSSIAIALGFVLVLGVCDVLVCPLPLLLCLLLLLGLRGLVRSCLGLVGPLLLLQGASERQESSQHENDGNTTHTTPSTTTHLQLQTRVLTLKRQLTDHMRCSLLSMSRCRASTLRMRLAR